MPWPDRRADTLTSIIRTCGVSVQVCPLRRYNRRPDPPHKRPRRHLGCTLVVWSPQEALREEAERAGDMRLGSRYWARITASHLAAEEAAHELKLLREQEGADVPMDTGALVLARVFAADEDSSWVPDFLDQLAMELRIRLENAGVSPQRQRREALLLLNSLLFGPRAPSDTDDEEAQVEDDGGRRRPRLPSPGYGMGLTGDRDDYYNLANSMLHQVLLRRRGIPISLAVIQCSVALRCGMRLRTVNMPGHLLAQMEGGEEGEEEVYIDCFDGGRVMSRSVRPDERISPFQSLLFSRCIPIVAAEAAKYRDE
uniref:Protein SirB1 N-terminal domain-containing protein n=1 Tax=Tetraselmis chuii TaxID=63592 RepID=A0A6U1JKK0_9CHLO|mmetsp:Transcript_37406/g.66978  ORF Transcript_37406/g.66978 Transcript_37406/m.66978 type:complete len:312 (+) Transcript_37406:747-1682(+)